MKQSSKFKSVLILFIILFLPGSVYLLLYTGEHHFKKLPYIGPKEAVQHADGTYDTNYHKIPYFEFTNQDGEKVTSNDLDGKVYVADFFFVTCPTICPKMTTNMKYVQDQFSDRKDLRFISITVNPEHDTVEVLKEYAERVHANTETWDFLTGPKEAIYDVALNGFFVSAQKDEVAPGGFLHSQYLILIDKKGHIRGIFDGTIHKVVKEELGDAIDILFKEEVVPMKGEKKNQIEQRK
ncbi:MAG: SCO family protein [Flavobacteriales bacterium]|nr:SCO family protein [Flavobacteriales bacterium]